MTSLSKFARVVVRSGGLASLPLVALATAGCSFVLDLSERKCNSHSDCSANDSEMCIDGECEPSTSVGDDSATSTSATGTDSTSTMGTGTDPTTSTTDFTGDGTTTSATATGTSADGGTTCVTDCGGDSNDATTTTGADDGSSETAAPMLVELITNHGFEESIAPEWLQFGYGAVMRSEDMAYAGTSSALCTSRTRTFDTIQTLLSDNIVFGERYTVSAWLRLGNDSGPLTVALTRKFFCADDSEATYAPLASVTVTSTEWTQITGTLVVPPACDPFEVAIYFDGAEAEPPEDEDGGSSGSGSGSGSTGEAPFVQFPDLYVDEVYATPMP